ncbi:hypothetical protein TruAng_003058 [Truncatella angustata]|nr:hypothetical protein TruAng_003058 [Truncatella angustata]
MAARQSQEEGDLFPITKDLPATPSSDHIPTGPKRSMTPRGLLFPNLDEAHRKITSRLGPNNPFSKSSAEGEFSSDIGLQELCSPTSVDGLLSQETPEASGAPCQHVSDLVSPIPFRFMAGRSLTDRQSIAQLFRKRTDKDVVATTITTVSDNGGKDVQHHNITDSTVGHIVDQYTASTDDQSSSAHGGSELAYTFEPLNRTQGAATRQGFRGEEDRIGRRVSRNVCRETSSPPQLRILGIPNEAQKTSEFIGSRSENEFENDCLSQSDPERCASTLVHPSPSPRASSFGALDGFDAEWLTDNDSVRVMGGRREVTQSLVPQPLRIPSNRNRKVAGESSLNPFWSDFDTSLTSGAADASTSSHDDPFKYDNDHYQRMRQLGKEREVSCALRRISLSGTLSGILRTSDTCPQKISNAECLPQKTSDERLHHLAEDRCQEGSFFDPVAFRALHGDSPYNPNTDIRVVINKSSELTLNQKVGKSERSKFGLSIERSHRDPDRSPYSQVADGDWVTEATSEPDCDVTPGNGSLGQGIKATGSSIADYSDDAYTDALPRFSSRERIIEHPYDPAESYEMQDLKNTKRPASPRTYVSRFNGFGQNSSRFDSTLPKQVSSQPGLFNPFRRDYKRAEPSSYFTYKPDHTARAKYEFRDSTSTCAPPVDSNRAVCGTQSALLSTSMASNNTAELLDDNTYPLSVPREVVTETHKHKRGHFRHPAMLNIPKSPYQSTPTSQHSEGYQPSPMVANTFSDAPASTSSKFSFRLLDLSEAQEMQRIRRASEDTNKTESTVKGKRSLSEALSARPGFTPLPLPSAAYMRRGHRVRHGSHLSSTFTPPWQTAHVEDTPDLSEWTPLDASASRSLTMPHGTAADTPTASKRIPFQQNRYNRRGDHLNFTLPNDKRTRPGPSDRTLHSIMNRDIEAVRAAEDHYVSYKAKSRRQLFFYAMLCLSILPFFAILVLNGNFDNSLSWLTQGEVYKLTKKQRKVIKIFFVAEIVVYASLVAAIIAYYVTASKDHH